MHVGHCEVNRYSFSLFFDAWSGLGIYYVSPVGTVGAVGR